MVEDIQKLYVGNISFQVSEEDVVEAFAKSGQVEEFKLIKDKDSGRSKGFGFISFASLEEAKRAEEGMNGFDLGGRALKVNIAEDRPNNTQRRY